MTAYYSEHDAGAAAWLRELIADGQIPAGHVDDRDILDVCPADLKGFTQCHFFAGIGGWALALRLAGWPDDRPVWTGSCPCQSFSAAGTGRGFVDERHLWPAWFDLIARCRPAVIFGEQVEAAIGHGWLDLVQDDLEGIGYAVAPVGLPAACVGAPHIRPRLWFVGESNRQQCTTGGIVSGRRYVDPSAVGGGEGASLEQSGITGVLADDDAARRGLERESSLSENRNTFARDDAHRCGQTHELGDTDDARSQGRSECRNGPDQWSIRASSVGSAWADVEWIRCQDGQSRPTKPGLFPLADGVPARVGRLRGYGNAIVAQVAAEVIAAYMEIA